MQTQTLDIKDILLEAQADVAVIVREVLQEIALPQMLSTFRRTWAKMTDQQKEQFNRERPEEYRALMEMMK